jgi:hypothetical protein
MTLSTRNNKCVHRNTNRDIFHLGSRSLQSRGCMGPLQGLSSLKQPGRHRLPPQSRSVALPGLSQASCRSNSSRLSRQNGSSKSSPPRGKLLPGVPCGHHRRRAFDGALVRLRSEGDPSLDASHARRRESASGSVPFACVGCEKAGGDEQMRTKLMVTTKMAVPVAIGMVTALVP